MANVLKKLKVSKSKDKGQQSEPQGEIPMVQGYDKVNFSSVKQRERFVELTSRQVFPSRWICQDSLRILGILETMRSLFNGLGMSSLFDMFYRTREDMVYEFFSSVYKDKDDEGYEILCFRLANRDRTLTLRQFAQHFGLSPLGSPATPSGAVARDLWQRMTGRERYSSSKLHISHVQHPVFRIFLKFLCHSIFGRDNNHQTRVGDVVLLSNYVLPRPLEGMCIPYFMWMHLLSVAGGDGDIYCGGVISHIATLYGYHELAGKPDPCLMSIQFLLNAKDLAFLGEEEGRSLYSWRLVGPPLRHFTLPSPDLFLNLGHSDRPHYCLPGAIPDHLGGEGNANEGGPNPPNPPQPNPQQPNDPAFQYDFPYDPNNPMSPFEQGMMHQMRGLSMDVANQLNAFKTDVDRRFDDYGQQFTNFSTTVNDRLNNFEVELGAYGSRLDTLETNHRRALEPIYGYHYKHGHIQATTPHPIWFEPNNWQPNVESSHRMDHDGDDDDDDDVDE